MLDFPFNFLLLGYRYSQNMHFMIELFPILFFLLFLRKHFRVSLFNEALCSLYFFFRKIGYHNFFKFVTHSK